MAPLGPAPFHPGLFDLIIHGLVEPAAAATHRHLGLQLDTATNHVVADQPQRLPCIVVIPHQLAGTIAQQHQAGIDLRISAGGARHPVAGEPAQPGTFIQPPRPAFHHLSSRRFSLDLLACHQLNLTNMFCGLPRPAAIFSATFSRFTTAFSCASRSINAGRSSAVYCRVPIM